MTDIDEPSEPDGPEYSYKASVMGGTWDLMLGPRGVHWAYGFRSGEMPYDAITKVRLAFRPSSFQASRFVTEVYAGRAKLTIASTSWKSLVEHQRNDEAYGAFVTELHRRIASSAAKPTFLAGSPLVLYWMGLVVLAASAVAFVLLLVRAVTEAQWGAAALIASFCGFLGWQAATFFMRNRPRRYRPDALPADLIPSSR